MGAKADRGGVSNALHRNVDLRDRLRQAGVYTYWSW